MAETRAARLSAFDVLPDGSLSNRRVFAPLPEGVRPDGIALDAEGCVWLANPAGGNDVMRVREGGEILESVQIDTHAYAVALGGPQRRHLLICASDTHNSDETATRPSATLRLLEVEVPGVGPSTPTRRWPGLMGSDRARAAQDRERWPVDRRADGDDRKGALRNPAARKATT